MKRLQENKGVAAGAVIFFGIAIAAGVLLFPNILGIAPATASQNPQWTQNTGLGISAPACVSSSASVTCVGGQPSVTISWSGVGARAGPCGTGIIMYATFFTQVPAPWVGAGWGYENLYRSCSGSATYSTGSTAGYTAVLANNTTYSYFPAVDNDWSHEFPATIQSFTTPNCVPPTGTIQGFKVKMPGNTLETPPAGETVTIDGGSPTTANPYFFTNVPTGSHTVTVSVPSGWSVGYTLCYNDTACHGNMPTPGSSVSVNVPAGGFADLWWHYTPPPPLFDYSLSTSGNITVQRGSSGSNSITATLVSGATQSVSLSASGLPSGATPSFSPTSCNPTCTSALTISTLASTPTGTFPITVTGSPLGKTTSFNLTVTVESTLLVSLAANPSSGTAPLNGVDLTATVSGTAQGTINYTFYCNRSDSGTNITSGWAAKFDNTSENPKTAVDACNYSSGGTYTAKVIVERGSAPAAEARQTISVNDPLLSASCSVSPGAAYTGQNVTWGASASGGTGSYTYSWSGTDGLSGTTQSVQKSYSTPGNKSGNITVTSGSQTVGPQSCSNSVNVTPPPPCIGSCGGGGSGFTASPSSINIGQSSVLSWTSSNATSCSIDQGIGAVPTSGSVTVSPTTNTTYTLICSGPGGTATARVTVLVSFKPKFKEIPPE
ncbi:MAG: hypothetical protein WAP51_04470 [Candidatus Sungiibacteriota bacterium]